MFISNNSLQQVNGVEWMAVWGDGRPSYQNEKKKNYIFKPAIQLIKDYNYGIMGAKNLHNVSRPFIHIHVCE